ALGAVKDIPEKTRGGYKSPCACVCLRGGNAGSVTGYFASQEAESPVRAIPLDRGHFSRFDRARGRHAANHRSAETRRSELVEESSGRLGRAFRGRTRFGTRCGANLRNIASG